jgi:hypothetical protein
MSFFVAASRALRGTRTSSLSRQRHRLPVRMPVRSSGRRRTPGSALPLILALAVTGCAAQPTAALPAKSRQMTAPAALSGQTPSARQQVIAAYTGYWKAFAAAMSAQNAARARAIMAPYEPASAVAQTIKADRRVWAAHETAYGSAVPHILDVRLTGNRALVHDCLDLSHFGAQNMRTGRVVPESFGLPHLNFYVTVIRAGVRWLVTNMQPVEVPCGS